jgi:hypothetical protein
VAGEVAVTVAVYVIDWPMFAVRSLELTLVEVAPTLTVCVKLGDVEAAKLASPAYTAVIVLLPEEANDVAHVAVSVPVDTV